MAGTCREPILFHFCQLWAVNLKNAIYQFLVCFLEMAKFLIENGFKLKTTLLRMIEIDNPVAVTFICEHKDIIQVTVLKEKGKLIVFAIILGFSHNSPYV